MKILSYERLMQRIQDEEARIAKLQARINASSAVIEKTLNVIAKHYSDRLPQLNVAVGPVSPEPVCIPTPPTRQCFDVGED